MATVDTDIQITTRVVITYDQVIELYEAMMDSGTPEFWIRLVVEENIAYLELESSTVTAYLQGPDGQETIIYDIDQLGDVG